MKRTLRIAHTSDVHLHDDSDGAVVREAFAHVVDAVVSERAELFLIAGDLFDHNRVKGHVVEFVYEQLARVDCPTVIISGNHDCFEERSVLRRMDFRHAGHHVTLLEEEDGKTVTFPELHATVWGRGMVDHTPAYRPVAGAPGRTDDLWHIGMAHGLYVDYPETERSSLITPEEIAASGFDYLALGHVHLHRQMRHGGTLACYPGVPAASYGTRPTGSFAMVTLTPGRGAKVDAHPIAPTARRAAEAVC